MYLENFERARTAVATPVSGRRSLSGEFVFISQDDSVAFLAEACIDVLRSANRLTGQPAYDWVHIRGEAELSQACGPVCGPDQTLVLIGGTDAPWQPSADGLTTLRAAIRNAARVCVVGAAVFVPLAAGVLATKRLAVHPSFRPGVEEGAQGPEIVEGTTCHHKAMSSATGHVSAIRMMVDPRRRPRWRVHPRGTGPRPRAQRAAGRMRLGRALALQAHGAGRRGDLRGAADHARPSRGHADRRPDRRYPRRPPPASWNAGSASIWARPPSRFTATCGWNGRTACWRRPRCRWARCRSPAGFPT